MPLCIECDSKALEGAVYAAKAGDRMHPLAPRAAKNSRISISTKKSTGECGRGRLSQRATRSYGGRRGDDDKVRVGVDSQIVRIRFEPKEE
jgi:hypothetical protein